MAILKNQSRRLYSICGIKISPTGAKEVPDEYLTYPGVKQALASGELALHDEEVEPITDKAEAEKDSAKRKKAGGTSSRSARHVLPKAAQKDDE